MGPSRRRQKGEVLAPIRANVQTELNPPAQDAPAPKAPASVRQRSVAGLLIAAGLILSLGNSHAGEMKTEPSGYGVLRFGSPPEQVERLYPGARRLNSLENLGAVPVTGPAVVRYVLENQKIPGFSKPVRVELRFWKNRLWVVIVYYGENAAEQVVAAVKKQVGDPENRNAEPVWTGKKTTVSMANRERWYALSDNAVSKEVQEDLMSALGRPKPTPADPAVPGAAQHP